LRSVKRLQRDKRNSAVLPTATPFGQFLHTPPACLLSDGAGKQEAEAEAEAEHVVLVGLFLTSTCSLSFPSLLPGGETTLTRGRSRSKHGLILSVVPNNKENEPTKQTTQQNVKQESAKEAKEAKEA
jgi:hypothetical protein